VHKDLVSKKGILKKAPDVRLRHWILKILPIILPSVLWQYRAPKIFLAEEIQRIWLWVFRQPQLFHQKDLY